MTTPQLTNITSPDITFLVSRVISKQWILRVKVPEIYGTLSLMMIQRVKLRDIIHFIKVNNWRYEYNPPIKQQQQTLHSTMHQHSHPASAAAAVSTTQQPLHRPTSASAASSLIIDLIGRHQ